MGENPYKSRVFLSDLLKRTDYQEQRAWTEHQQMQVDFLKSRGFGPGSNVLDVGCGPLRLGVALIPELETGWYYGQDINADTLDLGRQVLADAGVTSSRYTLLCSSDFNLDGVDRAIDIAFSNSLFSHLSLNSILICLMRVRERLSPAGVYYSTYFRIDDGHTWLKPHPRRKWGRTFDTYPNQDPYHYSEALLEAVARSAGFDMETASEFGHPTQTMACFRPV